MKLVTTTFVDFLNDAEIIIIFGCTACYLDPFIPPISPEPDKPHQNNNDDHLNHYPKDGDKHKRALI